MNHRAWFSPLAVAVIGAAVSLVGTSAVSEVFPGETNTIVRLSPEQARKLAQEFPGVNVKAESNGTGKRNLPGCLPLNGLKALDAETAEALAGYAKGPLLLDGLTTLDVATATALARHTGMLSLNGLTTLDAEAADALARHTRVLVLKGLTTLSDEAAKSLGQHTGSWLYLDGLTTLSDEAADALAKHRGNFLSLDGLTTLSAGAARALAKSRGNYLSLDGLTTLSPEAARPLSQWRGNLFLAGLTTLSPEAARTFAAAEKWNGHLPAWTAFDAPESVATAQALATRTGLLSFPNLRKISPKTLAALIQKEDVEIPLIETLELIPEPDGSPTENFVPPAWLQERQMRQRAAQAAK